MRQAMESLANPVTLEIGTCPEYVEAARAANATMQNLALKQLKMQGVSETQIEAMKAMHAARQAPPPDALPTTPFVAPFAAPAASSLKTT